MYAHMSRREIKPHEPLSRKRSNRGRSVISLILVIMSHMNKHCVIVQVIFLQISNYSKNTNKNRRMCCIIY